MFLKLVDRDSDTILNEHLPKLLRQYKADSNFSIEMIFKDGVITSETAQVFYSSYEIRIHNTNYPPPNVFIFKMLKKNLEANGCKHIFTEYSSTGFLKKDSKRLMIRTATDYLITTFSLYPQYEEIVNVCSAIIEWFPAYA